MKLQGNPMTGYTWAVDDDVVGSLELQGEIEFVADINLAGAGRIQARRFQAVKPGEGALPLIYHRPFETGTDPIREFSASVVVK